MDRHTADSWQDVVSGIIVLATMTLLAVGIFFIDDLRREFLEGPALVLLADDVGGLLPGADVWVAGKPAGRVQSISFLDPESSDPGQVAVRVILLREAISTLRADAVALIGESSLLAPPVVKFRPGSASAPPLDFADTLVVTPAPGIETFLAFADSGRVAIAALSEQLARLDSEFATGHGTLPQLRRNPRVTEDLTVLAHRAGRVRETWARSGGFKQLAEDSVSQARLARLGESMDSLSELATVRSSSFSSIALALEELRGRTDRLDAHLQAARGTAGRLLYDGELQIQTERTRAQSDSVRLELATDPFRWLRFRLF